MRKVVEKGEIQQEKNKSPHSRPTLVSCPGELGLSYTITRKAVADGIDRRQESRDIMTLCMYIHCR